jgi:hypothetical protein
VRTFFVSSLVAVLSLVLIGIPATAVPANPASVPLGSVMQAERAHLGADVTSGGATIYDGDRLETQEDGTMRARLGGSQMYLRPSTVADVHGLSNGYSASLPSWDSDRFLARRADVPIAGKWRHHSSR